MQKQQLRTWLYAGVAVALVFGLALSQVDSQNMYQTLQDRLAKSGVKIQAESISLSPMYMGAIRLDGVIIQSDTFDAEVQRFFIDLDLAALLTGKAIAQALYLQDADINITQESQDDWLSLLKNDAFKLKRIDISQSEIHFEQQHLTLEKVDLDIRDIGKNKNPRLELRAHVGDGRIDAHGYLHIKRGEITKGFGRVKLFDIPFNNWNQGTNIQTLSGSITSHLNQDESWQSFGHLSLQTDTAKPIEVRAKIIGDNTTFLSIDEMVFNHQKIGAVQVTGQCETVQNCNFIMDSKKIAATPLLNILNIQGTTNANLENTHITTSYSDGQWFTSADTSWQSFDYTLKQNNDKEKTIVMPTSRLKLSNFIWHNAASWQINQLSLFSSVDENTTADSADIELIQATYDAGVLDIPINLNQTSYWLPFSQWLLADKLAPEGQGTMKGYINLTFAHDVLTQADIQLDATDVELRSGEVYKPNHIPLTLHGRLSWAEDKLPDYAEIGFKLDESTFHLRHEKTRWFFSDMDIDFDALAEVGIRLPQPWQTWHGYIRGETTLHIPEKNIIIEQADVDLIQFGKDHHIVDGQIQTDGKIWHVQNLHWMQDKNEAEFFGGANNHFDIQAESLDAQALILLQSLPFQPLGNIKTKALRLPFGTLSQVEADYQVTDSSLDLSTFKSKFYEGTLKSEKVRVFPKDKQVTMKGTIQVGGIRLNNWLWLHKQLDAHLEASVYATLNLEVDFDINQHLTAWKGDGEVSIYNGLWLLNGSNIKADKLIANIRKRKEFNASFTVKNERTKGKGKFRIDEDKNVSGQLLWLGTTYNFNKTWPHFKYQESQVTP